MSTDISTADTSVSTSSGTELAMFVVIGSLTPTSDDASSIKLIPLS
jgi:hypothetical protein